MNEPENEQLALSLVEAFEAFESCSRRFYPGILPEFQNELSPMISAVEEALRRSTRAGNAGSALDAAAVLCLEALRLVTETDSLEQAFVNFRKAGRKVNRALETVFPHCASFPAIHRYFLEPDARNRVSPARDGNGPPEGLFHLGCEEDPYARGCISWYAPVTDEVSGPRPLVVALHGGFGHGRDFIWQWLREARSRGFVLACPTSRQITWSITGQDIDRMTLANVLVFAAERLNIDTGRMLLTGFSDGATYALKCSLIREAPFSHYAILSGILPPFDLAGVRGHRISWIHGAKDWMFPAWRAKTGEKQLSEAGADVTLEIIPDLYHAYPREKNGPLLEWFDPRLALTP